MTENRLFLRAEQSSTGVSLAHYCHKKNQLSCMVQLHIMLSCLAIIQSIHKQNKLCLNIHPRQFYLDIGAESLYLATSGLIVKRNIFGQYRARRLIGDHVAPELISQYWAYEQCAYTVQTDIYALGQTFASFLGCDLDVLREKRLAHPNVLFFEFAVKEHYLRGKDAISLRMQLIKLLLRMTDDDPRRRPSIGFLLHAVHYLMQQATHDAKPSTNLLQL